MSEANNLFEILLSLARLEVLVKRMEEICDETERMLGWNVSNAKHATETPENVYAEQT